MDMTRNIQKDNQRTIPVDCTIKEDWRDKMTIMVKILVPIEELIQPLDDIWEDLVDMDADGDMI